jgi:nicotinate-nucleotide pyrophosphorylase (carboxylating)
LEELERSLDEVVKKSLAEDAARGDVTTRLLIRRGASGDAVIKAKASGVVSGHAAAELVFKTLDKTISYVPTTTDASRVERGQAVARMRGRVAAILAGERTALNFLQHLSGVATLTASFVELVKGTGVTILDTRKTTPGLRPLEKRAVVHGGGQNHRWNLAQMILVKENHLKAAGGLRKVVAKLGPENLAAAEIEITSLDELSVLRETPPMRIMLDNFTPEMVREAVVQVKTWGAKPPQIEVSGGVDLGNVVQFAIPGVDFISIGSLTAQAPVLDMSLLIEGTY